MRYLITGGSGYLGSKLVGHLASQGATESILIADVKPPRVRPARTGFRKIDVCDAAGINELIANEAPDAIIHLAFIVDPTHDEPTMYETNVNGTFNVLAAASAAKTEQVMILSSTMAYGPWADNPVPISETQPVRGHAHYMYARHAAEADRIAQLWATLHPDRTMTMVRACTIVGKEADNHLVRMWQNQPFFPDFGGPDHPTQFISDGDAVDAIGKLVEGKHAGVFNLAADGDITWQQCAELAGLPVRNVRETSFNAFKEGMWRMKDPSVELPPSFSEFLNEPWLTSNAKIKRTLSWQPKQTSRQAFEQMLATRKRVVTPA